MRRGDSTWHALMNATVHVMPGRTLEHATVVVRGGRIVSVEAAAGVGSDGKEPASPAAPAGAQVWDCKGLHVYPAFIDPYVEVDAPRPGKDDPGRHWNGGVTPERNALDGAGLAEASAKELRELGFGAAGISPRGGLLRGTGSVVSLAKREDDASSVKPAVYASDVYQAAAFDTGGVGESTAWQGYPGSEMGAIALVRQTLIDADWQSAARAAGSFSGPANALDSLAPERMMGEPAGIAGGPGAGQAERGARGPARMPLLFDCGDELDVLRAQKVADEFGRSAIILGSGLEFKRLAALAGGKERAPVFIEPVSYPESPKMSSVSEAEGVDLREMMTWEQAPTNLRRLREAGLKVALTTSKLRGKGRFWDNVRLAIRHGLAPDDAMAMVTTVPAGVARVSDRLGTVEAGKIANLTVTDGDWFDPHDPHMNDGGKKPRIREVWIDGKRHEVTAAPGLKLEGVWDVTISPASPAAAEGKFKITFTFDGDNGLSITKLEAQADGKVKQDTIKPKEQRLEKNRLSFTFEHEPFGEPGVFITQGTVEGDEIFGDFLRASGVKMKFAAKKRPALAALGEWRVIELDGKAKAPADRGQVRVTIAKDSVKIVVTDVDGKRIAMKGEDVKVGVDEKREMERVVAASMPAAEPVAKEPVKELAKDEKVAGEPKAEDSKEIAKEEPKDNKKEDARAGPEPANFAASFRHDLEKLGGKGKSSDTLVADPSNPDVLIGEGIMPKEEGQDEAIRHSYKLGRMTEMELASERAALRPRGVVGTWRMVLVDDDAKLVGPKPEEPGFIVIDEKGGVVLKGSGADGKPVEVKAVTRKVSEEGIAYDVDMGLLDPAREAATVRVEGRRLNDLLVGTMVVPDGSTHTWKAARVAIWGDEPGDDDAEILEAASVPEGLVYPFGPYGVSEPPKQQTVAIVNGTFWTEGPQGILNGGAMLIVDGRIAAIVAPDAKGDYGLKIPKDAVVIDAKGKQVTPGLIDCHSHTGISRGVNEFGQAVTAEVRIGDVTNPDAISWYRQLAGGITAVNNLHGSANPIGGQNQVNKNRWGCLRPDDMHFEGAIGGIKFALGENVKQGNGDRVVTRYPKSRMGVETLMRDRFTAAKEYIAEQKEREGQRKYEPGEFEGFRKTTQDGIVQLAGQRDELAQKQSKLMEELFEITRKTAAMAERAQSTQEKPGSERDQLANKSKDVQTQLSVVNQQLVNVMLDLEALRSRMTQYDKMRAPFHRDLELEALAEVLEGTRLVHCHSYRQDEILMLCRLSEDFGFKVGTFQHILEGYKVAEELLAHSGGASGFSDWWAYKVEVQDAIPQGGPIMHDQGIVVSYNSDSDEMARRMNVEAGKAIKYSAVGSDGKPTISPEEALKFVTLNPARQLRIDGKVGSLEAGKDGDFVIWSGPPMSPMSKAEQTWIDGRCYFSLQKDAASRERIARERARLIQKILGGGGGKGSKKDPAAEGTPRGPGDAGGPGGGRRRRRPEDADGLTSGAEDPGADEGMGRGVILGPTGQPVNWWMRSYYYERYMRGLPVDASMPGECGCAGF